MRTIRIYQAGSYNVGETIDLSPAASHHVAVVLRMNRHEKLTLFCGDDREFSATIVDLSKKKVTVSVDEVVNVSRESPRKIHLAQALSKGERMEFVIQKSVELGVTGIFPMMTSHSVVRLDEERLNKKLLQWQAIAIAACEQSYRTQLPIVHPVTSFDHFIARCQSPTKFILDTKANQALHDCVVNPGDITLLIGPEGGLSEAEIIAAKDQGFQSLRLGPRVLRTETAAIVAISVIQASFGDLY